MKKLLYLPIVLFSVSCSQQVFVVRHAEKAAVPAGASRMEASDPPLSTEGTQRAEALKQALASKKIRHAYSTNYKRTIATVQPTADAAGIIVQRYHPAADSLAVFAERVRGNKGNVLIAGHSNTVDDIVNKLAGDKLIPGDLTEATYDRLFILRKKMKGYSLTEKKYGKPTP